jgi:hypothetical protein
VVEDAVKGPAEGGGMKFRHGVILVVWTLFVLVVTGTALFMLTYGDCFDNATCTSTTNRNGWLVIGISFVVYWTVTLLLARKWNRDVF